MRIDAPRPASAVRPAPARSHVVSRRAAAMVPGARQAVAATVLAAMLCGSAGGAARAQAVVPPPPLEDLVVRPDGWQALPRRAPTIAETFAGGCVAPDPELEWARLPRPLREVPLEAMIGQLLVVSFSGKAPDDAGVRAARAAIAASRIGGVLFFRHNIGSADEVRAVNAAFADARPFRATGHGLLPLLAVDQEGGAVMRLKATEGAPATPSARELAAASPEEAKAAYAQMAKNLAELGFTANFGPVVDLEVNSGNPVIAQFGRSYGADPAKVVEFAAAFVAAHRAAGVATALKHFPGHGSSTDDSHEGAIDLGPTWRRAEMVPFRDLVRTEAADMVMAGHLTLAGVTGDDGLPASISPAAIGGFLRETLCYGGIVVSDDLAMDAIARKWTAVEATRLMVEAGGDVALLSLPAGTGLELIEEIVASLTQEARRSQAFADKVRHAYARLAHHKLNMADGRPGAVELAGAL